MRTTINLDDQLLKEVKAVASETGRTLTSLVEDALREVLARRKAWPQRKRVELPVSTAGGWTQPGVDIDDSAALLDLMDRAEGRAHGIPYPYDPHRR